MNSLKKMRCLVLLVIQQVALYTSIQALQVPLSWSLEICKPSRQILFLLMEREKTGTWLHVGRACVTLGGV